MSASKNKTTATNPIWPALIFIALLGALFLWLANRQSSGAAVPGQHMADNSMPMGAMGSDDTPADPNSTTAQLAASSAPADVLKAGQQVFATRCAACHGANLEGQANWKTPNADGSFRAPPLDGTGHTWHHDDATLLQAIRLGGTRLPANVGSSPMPAHENILTPAEIDAVLAFIKSSWPLDIQATQAKGQP